MCNALVIPLDAPRLQQSEFWNLLNSIDSSQSGVWARCFTNAALLPPEVYARARAFLGMARSELLKLADDYLKQAEEKTRLP